MPELAITSFYVDSRVDSNTFTMGNPMPESTLTPGRNLGFGIWPQSESFALMIEGGPEEGGWGGNMTCTVMEPWKSGQHRLLHGRGFSAMSYSHSSCRYTFRNQTIIVTQITHGMKDQRPYLEAPMGSRNRLRKKVGTEQEPSME
jgi:hypothetical protein